MKPSGSLGALTRSKRGQALIVAIALAGGLGIGALMSMTVHPRAATTSAPLEITPSANIIGSPLTRQPTPPLTGLVDQNGQPVSLADEKGHVVLVAFMDPLCVNLCPLLGRDIVAVEQALPKGISPVLLIVSVVADRTPADVAQFILYLAGSIVTLFFLLHRIPGGWQEVSQVAAAAGGKLRVFDFSWNLATKYTFWSGVIGGAFLTMASHGTDQAIVQRLLAARNQNDSRKALLASGGVGTKRFDGKRIAAHAE